MDDVNPVSTRSESTARAGLSGIADFRFGRVMEIIAIIDGAIARPCFTAFVEADTALL